ncbi:MAG: hypothetical protein GY943_31750, partial [Chloroflexi bacterium]|nr:hypothetical protein [Chloroflexota bacterium]
RTDKIAELDVDFGVRLTALGAVGTFDEDSVRVVEVDVSGSSLDTDVPFQFDNGSSEDEPAGTLVFVMVGSTAVSATRYYHIYFDTTGAFSAPTPPADRVVVKANQGYRGQSSFVIETLDSDNSTVNAAYYYHRLGGGFASIYDRQGNDWISYQQGSGTKSGGEYRGIPNLGKVFHPGYSNTSGNNQGSNSTITNDGALKVTIRSVTKEGEWEVECGIYPTY